MTDALVEPGPWSRRRWRLTIAFVMLLQFGLIYLLEKIPSVGLRKLVAVPQIHLRERVFLEPLALSDPTLFVLPHVRGFSGEAWLNRAPVLQYQPADWTEPPRVLSLATAGLGAHFKEFLAANTPPHLETLATLEPPRATPAEFVAANAATPSSSFRIEGALAQRRLLATPELRARESAELLGNSVVQVLVDAAGRVVSTVLLSPGGGPEQQLAGARALDVARTLRFAPDLDAGVMVGTLTFEWQTLPPTPTDAPVRIP